MKSLTDYVARLTDNKFDPELGEKIHQRLVDLHLENPITKHYDPESAVSYLESGISLGLEHLGLDLRDPSIAATPQRYAAMLVGELTKGLNYHFFPKCTAQPSVGLHDMVLQRNLVTMSLCEHHLQTIDGFTHIAYIPNQKLLGLSKFARIVEFFSRRPQVQERLTAQIYAALSYILDTKDIGVVTVARHYCMKARGAMQHSSDTTTDKMGGKFFTNEALRAEFLNRINAGS